MEQRMTERHIAAFTPEEKETLLNYLQSNAVNSTCKLHRRYHSLIPNPVQRDSGSMQ
jgi:hypothetical protein